MFQKTIIQIAQPAGSCSIDLLEHNIAELTKKHADIEVRFSNIQNPSSLWPFTSHSVEVRYQQLNEMLTAMTSGFIACARGGYGCSELLDSLEWQTTSSPHQLLIGFSDICALHSARYSRLGSCGIHGPMMGSSLWNLDQADTQHLIRALTTPTYEYSIDVAPLSQKTPSKLEGKVFGGCLSVLTNLLGTQYFPKNLDHHVLILEDTGESPGQVMRALQQWTHMGYTQGLKAIVLGEFLHAGEYDGQDGQQLIHKKIATSVPCPVFYTPDIGHGPINMPFQIGKLASIENHTITLRFETHT